MLYPTMRKMLVSFGWLAVTAAPASAQTIYTDRTAFDAATTNQVTSDFSNLGNASTQSNPYAGMNWTLGTSTALIISFDPNSSPDYQFNSGKVLSLARLSQTAGTFTPAPGVTAFGFDFGVRASDANTSVTINGIDYNAIGAPTLSFFGIVNSSGISPISIGFAASRGVFDNVTVAAAAPAAGAVPEPAAWAMMLIGFGIIGRAMRHRQRTSVRLA